MKIIEFLGESNGKTFLFKKVNPNIIKKFIHVQANILLLFVEKK